MRSLQNSKISFLLRGTLTGLCAAYFMLTAACAPKDFSGSTAAPSTSNQATGNDGQIDLPPTDSTPAQSMALTDLCVLTSPDYADGFANYKSVVGQAACEAYGLRLHELHYELYETEVRYLPKAQVESLVKQAAGVETITATTALSLRKFLVLVKTNTTPIAVLPTFY
jgi:hypothetical protein